ncbi:Uncharacterised protein [Mycobacteroides abscessus subsp. abscessus]|uniref:hypothetical protein n=1 Tax=Mycobacteroides abscessus TaxID=36809 RepID=UPI0009A5B06B|nr:hypothetical protein [Mycobacteroides abscessus]SLI00437.1 Uncharacterised protein [Mycobacteroides abscessus subsp. abscessus]
MKTIGKALVGSIVTIVLVLVIVAVLIYQLLASIPTWIWVLAVAYLLYRNRQLLRRGSPRARKGGKSQRSTGGASWVSDPGAIPPPVVYVVHPSAADPAPVRPQHAIANAPEPWKFT